MGDEEHIHVWDRDKYPAAEADYVEPDEMEDYDGTDDESNEETTDEIPIPDYIGTDVINY